MEEKTVQEIATSPAAPGNDIENLGLGCHSEEPVGDEESQKGIVDCHGLQGSLAMTQEGETMVTPAVQRQYEIWKAQAQEAKNLYPGLDMARELQNPQFAHLLKSGVDVRTAFEVVHRDQILPAAMQAAARAVERKLTAAMAGARPPESAMERVSPALARTDVSSMSKADRAEIIRRVRRGEIIRF